MEIKDILKLTGLSSTAHAIPNIIQAKQTWLKIFWAILLILSAIVCFILLIYDISNYFDREVVTKITFTNEISSEFPSVKICATGTDYLETLDLKKTFGNLITYCKFGEIYGNCENDFVLDYNRNDGFCFSFNTGKNQTGHNIAPKRISSIGKDFGLKVNLKLNNSNSPVKVLIYNSSMNSNLFNGDEIEVSSGSETNIILNRLYINKKEYPYSKCISEDYLKTYESYLTKFIFNLGYPYEQKQCFDICKNDLMSERLNCSLKFNPLNNRPSLNTKSFARNCTFSDVVKKYEKRNDYAFDYQRYNEICETRCPLECNSIQYNPVFNYVKRSLLTSSDVGLNVFYESLSYKRIEESAKTSRIDLISGIGGTLGLFLGISLLSFGEIFEILFLAISSILNKNKRISVKIGDKHSSRIAFQ